MRETDRISAGMRLNAQLTARVRLLTKALENIAGPLKCGGAMTTDEDGVAFPAEIAAWVKVAHQQHCVRCVARAAIDAAESEPYQPFPEQARTDIINLLANLDAVLARDPDDGTLEPDDAAVVNDIRLRWGLMGQSQPMTAPPKERIRICACCNSELPRCDCKYTSACPVCGKCPNHCEGKAAHESTPEELEAIGCEPTDAALKAREQRWKDPDWTCPRCRAVNYGIRETCRFCGFDSAFVSDGKLLEPVDDPASVGRVLAEVRVRREEQDAKHGGSAHDDTHARGEWLSFIEDYVRMGRGCENWIAFEYSLLDVAALAVAAIQSSRRKRNCPSR